MELTFSHFGYCLISCLELTFRELTLFVLSYFQKSRLDLTFVELTLTCIWN